MTEQAYIKLIQQDADGLRSLDALFCDLLSLPNLRAEIAGEVPAARGLAAFRRLVIAGPKSGDPFRIGIFAATHGDEPAGALAARELARTISARTELAENFLLHFYPVCNPSGYERNTRRSLSGLDLSRQFWRGSNEPEIQILENEMKSRHFHGIVQLHTDDTSEGLYGFVRGHTLTENLLRPALREAGKILPRNASATIDGFAARDGIIFDQYQGILAAPPEVSPVPFEIVIETPHHAPLHLQVEALQIAALTILREYRDLMSFAADL
jgi:predicted deacylase